MHGHDRPIEAMANRSLCVNSTRQRRPKDMQCNPDNGCGPVSMETERSDLPAACDSTNPRPTKCSLTLVLTVVQEDAKQPLELFALTRRQLRE